MSKQLIEERAALVATFESSRVAAREAADVAEADRRAVREFDTKHLAAIQKFQHAKAEAQTA